MRFHTDRRYLLPLAPAEVWAMVARVDHYQSWWPWLRQFDGERLADDACWRCVVQPPLPYTVRFDVALSDVCAPTSVRATIRGDVVGDAQLVISEREGGSEAWLRSSLEPDNRLLRAVARVASPVVRFGHDWVLDSGARQFIVQTGGAGPPGA